MPSKGSLPENLKLIKKITIKKQQDDCITTEIKAFFGIAGCLAFPYLVFLITGNSFGGFIVPYMNYSSIPTIYLFLVCATTTFHLYARNDKKELNEFLEEISNFQPVCKNEQFGVAYKKCIDISGVLHLKKKILYINWKLIQ